MSISELRAKEVLHRLEDLAADITRDYSAMMILRDAVTLLKERVATKPAAEAQPVVWARKDELAHVRDSAFMCHLRGVKPTDSGGWVPLCQVSLPDVDAGQRINE